MYRTSSEYQFATASRSFYPHHQQPQTQPRRNSSSINDLIEKFEVPKNRHYQPLQYKYLRKMMANGEVYYNDDNNHVPAYDYNSRHNSVEELIRNDHHEQEEEEEQESLKAKQSRAARTLLPIWLFIRPALEMIAIAPLPMFFSLTGTGIFALIVTFIMPRGFSQILLYPGFRLLFGTLYPAYASYKAVKTKNVKEYVSTRI